MDINVVITQMIILFLLMIVGYSSLKLKVISISFKDDLSNFIINVTMPLMIISSVTSSSPDSSAGEVLLVFVISFLTYLILPVVAFLLTKILKVPRMDRNLYLYITIFSNVGFMGFPVIKSIFGDQATFYTAIFNLTFNLLNFSLGMALMSEDRKGSFRLKNFLKPGIVASVLAIVLFFSKISLPAPLVLTMKTLGDTTTPMAMVVIGMSLSQLPLKSVFKELRLYPYTIIKQVIIPLLTWLVLRNFITNELILGVTVIVIAMPAATSTVLFANIYHKNTELAAKSVFITTLASLITIPIIAFFLL